MNQQTIDHAVNLATSCALAGNPVERITWIPPTSATQKPEGHFIIKYAELDASGTAPWDRQ